jgi:hypothetical protein
MATTSNTITATAGQTEFSFSFPYLKKESIKVTIDNVATTAFTIPDNNPTTVVLNSGAIAGQVIKIFRLTSTEAVPTAFFSGGAIRAKDLNNNFDSMLFISQERENQTDEIIQGGIADGSITAAKLDQTLQDRLEQSVSVKDFGAVGDGVTDDYAAITQAITAAAGQVLVFPAGVYRTSQQIFFKESNSIIRGEGDVTIKNMDGIDGRVGCAAVGNPYTATEAYNGDWKNYPPTTNVIVENIKFDYNRSRWFNDIALPDLADRWNSCCLSIGNAQYVTIKNCRVTDGKRQSIDITCPTAKYDYPDDSDDDRPGTLIEMINMPGQPVDVNGDAIFAAQFITINNCIAEGSGDDVIATHWCSNVLIKNSLFQYTSGKGQSSNTNCIEIDDGSRNITVDNCTAYNGMGGIEVKGHPPQPSPYNIIISNTRIINCSSPFENHQTDWEERVDGKSSNAWNQLLNTWYDVDANNTNNIFYWDFPNDDLSGASDIEVTFDDTNGTEVEAPSTDYTITFDSNQTAASLAAGTTATSFITFANGKAPKSTRVRIRRKFYKLSPGTEFECYTYNGESPLARGLTYSNIQIIAPQQRYSTSSSGKRNYLGVGRAFEIGAYNEVNLQNFYISDGVNDSGAGVDGYRPTQGQAILRASDNTIYCRNHGYRIGDPVKFEVIYPTDGSTGIVEDATNYWVKEITGRDRFKITSEWEKVTDTRPEYDPAGAAEVSINANGSAMLNRLSNGMFHIRDGVKSLSIDGVSIDGFGRIETSGGNPDDVFDPNRVVALQAINIVSSTRGALFVNNYRSNDGPIKVVDGTGTWQYTGHISNVYAYQSNGSTINQQPIDSANKNLAFSNITIVGYPEGRKWATNGPVTDVISEKPTTAYSSNAGAGSLMTNKTTGQLLTKVSDRSDNNFLNLTACAWASVDMSTSQGTGKGFRRQNNFSSWDKTAAGTGTFYLADNLTFSSVGDVLIFVDSPSGLSYAGAPVRDADNHVSFEVNCTNAVNNPSNPQYLRILVFGRPL